MYNSCVLSATTYGADMGRSMLNITYKDIKTNIWVRERTKVIDIIKTVLKNEMALGTAYQPPQRRPMDLACDYDKKRRQGRQA